MEKKFNFEGLRIADFTWVFAGPACCRIFADQGAEVIRIESRERPDTVRPILSADKLPDSDCGGYFNNLNRNKLSITLNLSHPKAAAIAKRIVSISDVVVENFSANVMKKLGLSYEELVKVKPDIIMVSASGFGHSGPYRDFRSYGPNLQALAGLTELTGFPHRAPAGFASSYADSMGGLTAALAVLMALNYKQKTGKGQRVDVSQFEGLSALMDTCFLDYSANDRVHERMGNRHPYVAPHGAYKCKGEERWCVIAVFTEEEWLNLRSAMGNPPWGEEERFSTIQGRIDHAGELDKLIGEWTITKTAEEAMEILQNSGVAAGVVQNADDLFNRDSHLKARGFYQKSVHPLLGERLNEGAPMKFSRSEVSIRRHAPLMGEHNNYVYGQLLGMPSEEIEDLRLEGVI
ncbi:MAG: CoA transferase [Candidatus Tectomicrobia bacterium]|uniref:CoA transferase n=1 Tax=Tectimicrobiota bacterium TaxID=2528274 RepID=A0A933GM91_UNCTE|nr:CoA transferase [Candidatus Tectomicrobia bacterium]